MEAREILQLEKNFFDVNFINNLQYLDNILDDDYLEIGKSGTLIKKRDVIKELSGLKQNRKIDMYNYECNKIDDKTYIIHYITKYKDKLFFRTSIWQKNNKNYKIIFHQASE